MLVVAAAFLILAVMYGLDVTTSYFVHDGQLEDRYQRKPLRMAKIEHSRGLMSLTNLPTKAFVHLKAATVVFSMDGTRADPYAVKDT